MPMLPSNNTKFIPCKTLKGLYYILPNDRDGIDGYVSKYTLLSMEEYRFKLVEEYNAITEPNIQTTFFETKDDCQKAIDWINSIRVMNKLSQESKNESSIDYEYINTIYNYLKNIPSGVGIADERDIPSSYYLPKYFLPNPTILNNSKPPKTP